ncbi:MAG: protein kinase [Bacteroidaceae bacterium]|nr:protein kinase [Bacteroidaceae bacterium]
MHNVKVPKRIDYKLGDIVNSKYRVEKSLGEGAFGHVYKVADRYNNIYALKLLRLWEVPSDIRDPLVERFEMEFKTGQIDSRYLVRSLDYGFANGNPFILMEFCPNGDLTSVVGKPCNSLSKIAADVLHGLHDLHINGKVHRDLKPENVLIKADGTAALTDFGIAGDRTKHMTERNWLGRPKQIFGTYAYMPPEQVNPRRGKATVLPTTDIFSFGVMMYQLLTGKLPFGKLEDQNDLVHYQKKGRSGEWDEDSLLSLPNGYQWRPLIEGCLRPSFEDRLQSAKIALKLVPQYILRNTPIPEVKSRDREDMAARLKVMHGEEYGNVYEITYMSREHNRLMLTIGRSVGNNISTNNPYVSRAHCTIETDAGRVHWRIRDGQWSSEDSAWKVSTNGTFVNSTEVSAEGYWLDDGDIITIGDLKFKYELY